MEEKQTNQIFIFTSENSNLQNKSLLKYIVLQV